MEPTSFCLQLPLPGQGLDMYDIGNKQHLFQRDQEGHCKNRQSIKYYLQLLCHIFKQESTKPIPFTSSLLV